MALICLATSALLLFGLLVNGENLPVSEERRRIAIAAAAIIGVLIWAFAMRFRAWMLHGIILLGLAAGCVGLSGMQTSIGAAMTILSIFWTCLLIGSIYPPPVARVYGALVICGIAGAFHAGDAVDDLEALVISIGYGLTIVVTMELLSRTSSRLREEAIRDPLTGLLNRKGLAEAAMRAMRVAFRTWEPVAIASFDLDDFKAVNDHEGHIAGDRLLVKCAEHWNDSIRPQDVLARPGGDEFVLILPGAGAEETEVILGRLARSSPVGFSHGIAVAMPGDSIEDKLREADAALIRAKADRRRAHFKG